MECQTRQKYFIEKHSTYCQKHITLNKNHSTSYLKQICPLYTSIVKKILLTFLIRIKITMWRLRQNKNLLTLSHRKCSTSYSYRIFFTSNPTLFFSNKYQFFYKKVPSFKFNLSINVNCQSMSNDYGNPQPILERGIIGANTCRSIIQEARWRCQQNLSCLL